jgi:hypothetical protein
MHAFLNVDKREKMIRSRKIEYLESCEMTWYGLEWTCTTPARSCNFMDLTITIEDGKLTTTLFEKEQNLHLFLPPTSSHPKGCGTGLVFGHVLRAR